MDGKEINTINHFCSNTVTIFILKIGTHTYCGNGWLMSSRFPYLCYVFSERNSYVLTSKTMVYFVFLNEYNPYD